MLRNVHSGKYLTVARASSRFGVHVHQWDETEEESLRIWHVLQRQPGGDYVLQNENNSAYLTVQPGASRNGLDVFVADKPDAPESQWSAQLLDVAALQGDQVVATLVLLHPQTGKYLNVQGGGMHNGIKVHLWDNPDKPETQWTVVEVPDAPTETSTTASTTVTTTTSQTSTTLTSTSTSSSETTTSTIVASTRASATAIQTTTISEATTSERSTTAAQAGTTVASTTTTATEGPGVPERTVVEIHGALRVEGNKLLDESGAPVRLRGMSLFWSQWMPRFWNADLIRWLAIDWKVTMVRAAMGVEWGGFLEAPEVQTRDVVTIVEAAIEAGIYVVIDWHDHAADQHLERAKAFFEKMAAQYGSYPNVIFELFNEPVSQDWTTVIKPYHEQVIPVIRAHSNNVIVLGTRLWSQDIDVAAEDPVRGVNLAYSMHFYASTHTQWLRDKASTALAKGIAIFVTEWGTCTASGDGALDLAEAQRWMDFLEENYISDANWAVDDKQESCAALKPGVNSTGHWGEDDLTESGRWVRQTLRSRWDRLYLKRVKAIGGKEL